MSWRTSSSRSRRTAVSGLIAFWLIAAAASGASLGTLGQPNVAGGPSAPHLTVPPLPQVSVPSIGGLPTVSIPHLLPTTSAPAQASPSTTSSPSAGAHPPARPTTVTAHRAPTNPGPVRQNASRSAVTRGYPPSAPEAPLGVSPAAGRSSRRSESRHAGPDSSTCTDAVRWVGDRTAKPAGPDRSPDPVSAAGARLEQADHRLPPAARRWIWTACAARCAPSAATRRRRGHVATRIGARDSRPAWRTTCIGRLPPGCRASRGR